MTSEKRPRPPVPPKNSTKQRSFSDSREADARQSDGIQIPERQSCIILMQKVPENDEALKENLKTSNLDLIRQSQQTPSSSALRQALPPEDALTLTRVPVQPRSFSDEELPVFYLPASSQSRKTSSNKEERDSYGDADEFEFATSTKECEEMVGTSDVHLETFAEYFHSESTASLQSIRIEPSPERTFSVSDRKSFSSDPDLAADTTSKPQKAINSDPRESELRKSVKGRGLRPGSLSKSLANLHSPADDQKNTADKFVIEKMNAFFGEEKETATALEAEIYGRLISGKSLKSPSGEILRKKSPSSWFLSSKTNDLPSQNKSKKTNPEKDEANNKLKDGLTTMKQRMKSFKKHVIGAAGLTEGVTPVEELEATFGIPIERCVMSSNKSVPLIVEKCVKLVEENGLFSEGIYRISGNNAAINELKDELNQDAWNVDNENERWHEVNVVSGLLKLFFRKLPDSLITDDLYETAIITNRLEHREKRLVKLKLLLEKLPKINFETFKFLSHHLNNIASHQEVNKMDAHNLSIMFGPSLVRPRNEGTTGMIRDMNDQTIIVETIIKYCDWLFGGWCENRSVPDDLSSEDSNSGAGANLQLLANAETIVAMQIREMLVEDETPSTFFPHQNPNRRSKRKHRNKSDGKDADDSLPEQTTTALDVEREIELCPVKILDLPFKTDGPESPFGGHSIEPFHKMSLVDGRTKVQRTATDRLDARTLDIHLVSNQFEQVESSKDDRESEKEKHVPTTNPNEEVIGATAEDKENRLIAVRREEEPPGKIKRYRAYDKENKTTVSTVSISNASQPTLLRKYSMQPETDAMKSGHKSNHANVSQPTESEKVDTRMQNLLYKTNVVNRYNHDANVSAYPPDYAHQFFDKPDGGAPDYPDAFEDGSLPKKTNIVVRGPSGRKYCVLSATDPSVLVNGPGSSTQASDEIKLNLDPMRCMMSISINLNSYNSGRSVGPNDIELRSFYDHRKNIVDIDLNHE